MQTILGSNGVIGHALAKELPKFKTNIRLVSRNPKKVNQNDELLSADLTLKEDVYKAIEGSEVAYLCIGLKYDIKTWRKEWPVLMRNVLDACAKYKCKLVFVDNVYAIDTAEIGNITEESNMKPFSKKGAVRKEIDQMILDDMQAGKVEAIIARCADYYGPSTELSLVMIATYNQFIKNKKAQWIGYPKVPHTYTYSEDAGKAMALLGNTPDAYNQIWNLPTEKRGFTGEDWVNLVAKEMGKSASYSNIQPFMVRVLGIFIPILREVYEMQYQFEIPYKLNSDKFEKRFGIMATPYEKGMKETLNDLAQMNPK